MNNPVIQCRFCEKPVCLVDDNCGWGFDSDGCFWHDECFQMFGNIELPLEEDRSEDWKPKT